MYHTFSLLFEQQPTFAFCAANYIAGLASIIPGLVVLNSSRCISVLHGWLTSYGCLLWSALPARMWTPGRWSFCLSGSQLYPPGTEVPSTLQVLSKRLGNVE